MKKLWKIIIFIIIICLLMYGYYLESKKPNSSPIHSYSKEEQLEIEIEELKEENFKLTEERNDLNSQLDEIKKENEYNKDLIDILRDQLESYGIEPYEL